MDSAVAAPPAAVDAATPTAPVDAAAGSDRLALKDQIASSFFDAAPDMDTPAAPAMDPAEGVEVPAATPEGEPEAAPEPTPEEAPPEEAKPDEAAPDEASAGPVKLRARNAQGEYVNIPDVKLEVQVGDKTYLKTPAELARMAVDGIAGQRFVAENKTLKDTVTEFQEAWPKVEQEFTRLQQALQEQQALNLELLSANEEVLFQRRQEWADLNSPERQAERLRAELDALRSQQAQAQQMTLQQQYASQHIRPAFEAALNAAPDVPNEMIYGRMMLDTAPLNGPDGKIPAAKYPELVAYLEGPFRQWLASAQTQAVANKVKAEQAAKAAEQAEARKKQAAVNQQQVGLRPTGSVPKTPAPSRDTPRDRASVKDAIKAGIFDS